MMKIILSILVFGCIFLCGCIKFKYPAIERNIFTLQIQKKEIEPLKKFIFDEGYRRIGENDRYSCVNYISFTDCVIKNYFAKEIITPEIKTSIQISMIFKELEIPSNFYKNMGINIVNLNYSDIREINYEIDRMEDLLYRKLIEIVGERNVVRGKL